MTIQWIKTDIALPNNGDSVLVIHNGAINTAIFEQGISMQDRERMKNGELPDRDELVWSLSENYHSVKRSRLYKGADEQGNNKVPYRWQIGVHDVFGQEIKYWAKLPNLDDFA